MKLSERYNLENMRNRAEEMVFEAIEKALDGGSRDVHVRGVRPGPRRVDAQPRDPALLHSLLAPLRQDPDDRHKAQVEIELAIGAGKKKLKRHPHHA